MLAKSPAPMFLRPARADGIGPHWTPLGSWGPGGSLLRAAWIPPRASHLLFPRQEARETRGRQRRTASFDSLL
eukprot:6586659-Pyramimonas_sp.AAC.1